MLLLEVFLRSPSVRCVAKSSTSDPEFVENVWNPAVAVMPLRTCLSEKYTKLLPSYKWVNDDESWVSRKLCRRGNIGVHWRHSSFQIWLPDDEGRREDDELPGWVGPDRGRGNRLK
ncbi:hypothetical protein L6452_09647 [Arctium lappa]|uniref:Uncharacterized protein n=1 Tax=Arctium lappa TaxID=4217 RepID=A0ACB9DL27_ARCLA|nr:hypothetical protein L6452_09647 [Arctium lappa]